MVAKNNTVPFIFEQNADNKLADKGIENLFAEILFQPHFTETIKKKSGKVLKTFERLEDDWKNRFREEIMRRENPDDFANFQPLINKIRELL